MGITWVWTWDESMKREKFIQQRVKRENPVDKPDPAIRVLFLSKQRKAEENLNDVTCLLFLYSLTL